jgi:hypothetical protein
VAGISDWIDADIRAGHEACASAELAAALDRLPAMGH